MDLEHNTRIEELEEAIDEIESEALQEMKTSERVGNCFRIYGWLTNEHATRTSIMRLGRSKQDCCKLFYDSLTSLRITIAISDNLAWELWENIC